MLNLVPDPAKEKERGIGEDKGGPGTNVLIGGLPLDMRTLITCPLLLFSLSEMLRMEDLVGKKESLFKGMLSRMSVRLIGKGVNARPSCNMGRQHVIRPALPIVRGMKTLGPVSFLPLLLLLRETTITGEMQEIRRCTVVAMAIGTHPFLRQTCKAGKGLGP